VNDTDRILEKLDELEGRVVALQVQVAKLEVRLETAAAPKASLVRDGTITVSGGAFGALVDAVLAHFAKG
jgi:hypothetical protein